MPTAPIIINGKEFKVSEDLTNFYSNFTNDLNKAYLDGTCTWLGGMHGTCKTTTIINILKKATQKNFTALYTNLTDVVSACTLPPNEEKFLARKELMEIDFLAIDEFDNRFWNSENAADLFGRTLESILRARIHNKLPTILASNSPNPFETFGESLKTSFTSLWNKVNELPILGMDYRAFHKLATDK